MREADVWDFHLHNLILNGICVYGEHPYYSDLRNISANRFRRFNFRFAGYRYDTIYRFSGDSPYLFKDDVLIYNDHVLTDVPFSKLEAENDDWGSERSWWFKDIPALPKYYDLRLNPVNACANLNYSSGNSGTQKGCVFCQRCYSYARISEDRKVIDPEQMFSEIFSVHGKDVLESVTKVMLITGDTPTEEAMLRLVEEVYLDYLEPNKFRGTYSTVTTVIKSIEGIQRLSRIDDTLFEFPIECFSRREVILGRRKGIPLTRVLDILSVAREYFKKIRVNYLVGLDDLESAKQGFTLLADKNLADDIIANIFVPYTADAFQYRCPQSQDMTYVYNIREIMQEHGFAPKKTGTTKDVFSHFEKTMLEDELVPPVRPNLRERYEIG